ncbi:hypothetical protein Gorai_011160, partial [Gossypium raimondii]|nr:hypothetical protein [Gossypium raimondii]
MPWRRNPLRNQTRRLILNPVLQKKNLTTINASE